MSSSIKPSLRTTAPKPTRSANVPSTATTSSRTKPDPSNSRSSSATTARSLNNCSAPHPKVPNATVTQPPQSRTRNEPSTRVRATTTIKGTLPGATGSTFSSRPPTALKEHTRPSRPEAGPASEESDVLRVAAESCAWRYMISTLEHDLEKSTSSARAALGIRSDELAAEEADLAESRVRYEAERLLEFYDELGDRQIAGDVVASILRFKHFDKTIGEATAAALRLASLPLDDGTHISQYNYSLDTVDGLEEECRELEVQLNTLIDSSTRCKRLNALLRYLLDILRGHKENVLCIRNVVQCCKENYRIAIGTLTLV